MTFLQKDSFYLECVDNSSCHFYLESVDFLPQTLYYNDITETYSLNGHIRTLALWKKDG